MSLTVSATTQEYRTGTVVTLVLVGEADARSAAELDIRLARVADEHAEHLRELRFELSGLTYLSSAGLRSLVVAHQRLGRGVRFVLTGASEEVAETIRLTGFDRTAVLEESVWR
jgi:anti-sigma B factor antagonist